MTTMPAGTYYVGDLCYVLKSRWDEFCDKIIAGHSCLDGEMKFNDGVLFATYGTAWGDGTYQDQNGNEYCVDAGLIGCVAIEHCDETEETIREDGLGHIFTFDRPFKTYAVDGVIHISDVEIDTN